MGKDTFYWLNTGFYRDDLPDVFLLACYYTHKDGRKMKYMVLTDEADIVSCMSSSESSRKAVSGGVWYPTGSKSEINKRSRGEIHKIIFSPF